MDRRERKKRETRRAIRSAALRLVTECGYEALTTEAISERADIALRTFFNYFRCKEEALVANNVDDADALREAFSVRRPDEPPLVTLRTVLQERAKATTRTRAEEAVTQLRLAREIPALLPYQLASFAATERILAEQLAERTGGSPTDLRPAVLAAMAATVMRVATGHWLADRTRPLDDVVAEVFDAVAEEHRA